MGFNNNIFFNNIIKTKIQTKIIRYKPIMMSNVTIYNPIIGLNLGIPLNILQYVFTNTYYNENIVNKELVLMQFAIGIFTYGSDRLLDAISYRYTNISTSNSNEKLDDSLTTNYYLKKKEYYDYLLNNINANIFTIVSSYIYIFNYLKYNEKTYPLLIALTSTIYYRDFKKQFGYLKPIYIGLFWTMGTVLLPCIIHDNNYEILNHPTIYIPNFLLMFSSSNLLDIKDIEEDKKENIKTLAISLGENNSKLLSNYSSILAFFIFLYNFI